MNIVALGIIARAVELYEQNVRLRKEVSSRRKQADTWRKKCRKLEKLSRENAKTLKRGEQAEFEDHINEVMDEGDYGPVDISPRKPRK